MLEYHEKNTLTKCWEFFLNRNFRPALVLVRGYLDCKHWNWYFSARVLSPPWTSAPFFRIAEQYHVAPHEVCPQTLDIVDCSLKHGSSKRRQYFRSTDRRFWICVSLSIKKISQHISKDLKKKKNFLSQTKIRNFKKKICRWNFFIKMHK